MRKMIYGLVLGLMCFAPGAYASGDSSADSSVVYICHKGLHYTHNEVIFAYRGFFERSPVDNKELQTQMLKDIGFTPDRYRILWNRQGFRRGLFAPRVLENDGQVIKWVASSFGGLGYVHKAPTDNPDIEVCGMK